MKTVMTPLVCSFKELTATQQLQAGGKGGALARLYQAGYPVPNGFVILPGAFCDDELTPVAWEQARTYLERLRQGGQEMTFAVRSSALSEDSAQASFAGEFETVLGVTSEAELIQAIQTVRCSRHTERVHIYSTATSVNSAHEIAVVVQRLVWADLAGVLFTADPLSGSRAQMPGNFVQGQADKLVSGQVSGESFSLAGRSGLWPGVDYSGPAELKPFARPLYQLGRRLEQELGGPQDIEWATAEGKLYLLQARPITTLRGYNPTTGEWNDSLTGDYLWTNVNFGEAVTEVMTPLSWTVLQFIFGQWVILPGYQTAGNIGGRPYLNISLLATVFHALGRQRQSLLETLEGTLYMRLPPELEIPRLPLSRWAVLATLPHLIRLRVREKRAVRELPAYLAANPARCRQMRAHIQAAQTKAALLALWRQTIEPHLTWSVWLVMGSVSHHADYTTRLRRQLTGLVGPDDADALISNLSDPGEQPDGAGLLASLGPLVGLARVARGEMNRAAYLELYGHRGPDEFELSVPRPAEDSSWLDRQVAQFSQAPVDVEAMLANQRARFEAAWERFQARYPRQAPAMRRRIAQVPLRARLREAARSEYTRDRWLARTFALRAGELTGLGEDIFFLTLEEMLAVLAGTASAPASIPTRRETYQRYKSLPPYPSLIRGRFDPCQWAAAPDRRSDIFDASAPFLAPPLDEADSVKVILGSPGAAGQVEGVVRRLDQPEEGPQLQLGEVLVTMQTNIAWTPLFPRAAALITDVGAPLSHAAIVARELGIPAVVGCGNATSRLKTGDRVRVDGGRGLIEILDGAR